MHVTGNHLIFCMIHIVPDDVSRNTLKFDQSLAVISKKM